MVVLSDIRTTVLLLSRGSPIPPHGGRHSANCAHPSATQWTHSAKVPHLRKHWRNSDGSVTEVRTIGSLQVWRTFGGTLGELSGWKMAELSKVPHLPP